VQIRPLPQADKTLKRRTGARAFINVARFALQECARGAVKIKERQRERERKTDE
jgi:hypothetical protein